MASSQEVTIHDLVDRINFHNFLEGNPKFALGSGQRAILKRINDGMEVIRLKPQYGKTTLIILIAIAHSLSNRNEHVVIATTNKGLAAFIYEQLIIYTKMTTSDYCFSGSQIKINGTVVEVTTKDTLNSHTIRKFDFVLYDETEPLDSPNHPLSISILTPDRYYRDIASILHLTK